MCRFILQLLRTRYLGWTIWRQSSLTNLLKLSKIWAMHICNSLNLNKKGTQSQMCLQTHFSELLVSPVIYLKLDRSFQSKQHTKQKFNFKARTFNLKNTFITILRKAHKITRLLSSIHGHRNWKMKEIKNRCRISYILFNQSLCKILLHFLWLLSAPKKFR